MSPSPTDNRALVKHRRSGGVLALGLLAVVCWTPPGVAAEGNPAAENRVGRTIRIDLPITGQTFERVKRFVRKATEHADADGPKLVLIFEFDVPPKQAMFGRGSEFGAAYDMANLLTSDELNKVRTVAYVPQPIQGHAVLPVLACDEIVMAKDATIGLAGCDEKVVTESLRGSYREIADRRRTVPAQVVLWLLDPKWDVLVVETEVSREFITPAELGALKDKHAVKSTRKLFDRENPDRSLAAERGVLTGAEARSLKFVSYLAENRQEVAKALDLPPGAVEEDPWLVGAQRPVRVNLRGPINADLVSQVQRLIEEQVRINDVNFVCLWIDSPGGSMADSVRLANFLSKVDPAGKVFTVAYLQAQARSDAALIALACKELVMTPGAELGGPGAREFSKDDVAFAREAIRDENGPWKGRSWSLVAAMIDPQLPVFRCTRPGAGDVEYFCEEELAEYQRKHPNEKPWQKGEQVTRPGEQLLVGGHRAVEYHLANRTVEGFAQFKLEFGLENDPTMLEPGWADFLIEAMASPGVAAFLLMIGFVALYVELHTPGVGIGGFVATVCFVLFFWSHYLGGTAGWLQVALFAAGIGCLLLEFFVLPGYAIFGLGGGVLVLLSLILASQTFVVPRNAYQFEQLQRSLLTIIAAGAGFLAAATLLRKWLPRAPIFNQVMLEPPTGQEAETISRREATADFHELLGARGTTTTQLTPSGKARFGDRLVDVASDGDLIARGAEVEVVRVHGNRVLVKVVGSG